MTITRKKREFLGLHCDVLITLSKLGIRIILRTDSKASIREIEGYTSSRLPVRLVFSEQFPCERQIKGWRRGKKAALMRGDWAEISRLAQPRHPSRTSG
jgi:hypothetical protein